MDPRATYLQFHVRLDRRARWYRAARAALGGVRRVRWQDGNFHITVAFVNDKIDLREARAVAEILDGELVGMHAPVITFDTLEAFTTQGGGLHVVYLTASRVPDAWAAFVDKVRTKLTDAGYQLGPYKMHVTLARVPVGSIDLNALRARIGTVDVPKISSTLSKADYRFYQVRDWTVREWGL